MAGRWNGSLGLVIALFGAAVHAQNPALIPIARTPARTTSQTDNQPTNNKPTPAASLDRPVTLQPPIKRDLNLKQTAFLEAPSLTGSVIRGQSPDEPRPLPKGPSVWGEAIGNILPDTSSGSSAPLPGGQVIATSARRFTANGPEATVEGPPLSNPVNCGSCSADYCDSRWCFGAFMGRLFGCGEGWNCTQPANGCFYFKTEYLLWWTKGDKLPPLVTTGAVTDLRPGALGMPGTAIHFGGKAEDSEARSGVRATLGFWLDECHHLGIEGSFFTLFQKTDSFAASSPGSPVLARPFFNVLTGNLDAELVAFPGVLAGGVEVTEISRLFGADLNLRANLLSGCCYNVDILSGFRFIGLDNNLTITENLTTLNNPGGGFIVQDRFGTQNRFYGGQIGFDSELRWRRWFVDMKSMFAMGSMHEVVNIAGNTVVRNPAGTTSVFSGGLLALSSNSGHFAREIFVFAPEMTVNLGYQITNHARCFVGYNLMYLSNVVRPGGLIDTSVNTNLLPPPIASLPARPAFAFKGTDFWAQGVNLGLEFRY
jgi:hypothetical protein